MTIAVTGACGFVGARLCRRLRALGDTVAEYDLQRGTDVCSWTAVERMPPCDIVVHLAGSTFVPDAFRDPRTFYHANIVGTLNMLEFCRKHAARMVFMSSYVYGTPVSLPIDEAHPRAAHNPYAQSKIACEDLCMAYCRDFGVPSVMLRPFNIYGPGQREDFLVPSIVAQARTGVVRLKDPRPRRDFVHVDDVVEALVAAIRLRHASCTAFNVGSGASHSVDDVVATVARLLGGGVETVYSGEQRAQEVLDTVAAIRKAAEELRWRPAITLDEGLRTMLDTAGGRDDPRGRENNHGQ